MNHNFINSTVIVSSSPQIIEQVQSCFQHKEHIDVISSTDDSELLSIELPDLIIIDFTDWGLAFSVLDRVADDPWLHFQNIITVVSGYDTSHQSGHRGINILAKIPRLSLTEKLPVVLDLVRSNKNMIFHRGYETTVSKQLTGSMFLGNSLLEIETAVNLTCAYLYNANKIDDSRKNRLKTALTELLVNGLEHGNCEIGFAEKRQWLEGDNDSADLIALKLEDPEIAKRQIEFAYEINEEYSQFVIIDDGAGFDWKQHTEPNYDETYDSLNGRGITMARVSASLVEYEGDGNRVRCSIDHQEVVSNTCPVVFSSFPPETVSEGATLLKQGDHSNYLYFIVRGRYLVSVNDKAVSVLTPDDIFMGEMSFLLNGKRSATITALTEGVVVRISKREFITAIRDYPYYSLFLSRLLARRLAQTVQ